MAKGKVSGKTHTQTQLNDWANQNNPNNKAYRANADIPTNSEIDKFEKLVSPMDRAIRANFDEICHLQSIRDSLLPRLMSGEIDVSEIEV